MLKPTRCTESPSALETSGPYGACAGFRGNNGRAVADGRRWGCRLDTHGDEVATRTYSHQISTWKPQAVSLYPVVAQSKDPPSRMMPNARRPLPGKDSSRNVMEVVDTQLRLGGLREGMVSESSRGLPAGSGWVFRHTSLKSGRTGLDADVLQNDPAWYGAVTKDNRSRQLRASPQPTEENITHLRRTRATCPSNRVRGRIDRLLAPLRRSGLRNS